MVLSPVLLAGCAAVVERTPFRATDDLVTTTPRYLAEAGHSTVVSPPPGVRFSLALEVVQESPRKGPPSQRYELTVTVTREGLPWAADVHGVELVDDQGATLRPTQVLRQASPRNDPTTSHLLCFDLPVSYQARGVQRVTVHWALVAPGRPPVRVSSLFRR